MSKKTKRQIEDEKDYGGRSLFDLIELEFSQGEENEQQNRELSEHREVTDNIERTSISSNTPSVDRQENSTIQLDNTREMGRVLSEHNQESRNVRSNDTSIATNTNGISNLGEQRSRQEERTGANRYGDTSRRANKSQSIHSDRTVKFEEELAKDVLEIITVFSARLYGSRSKKNKKLLDEMQEVVVENVSK
ncbi:hypothetical protein JRR42_002191 [Campylobacter coli]|nr:hypothetical protein [Campylobacter coli]EHD2716535.1 hypothetical protein [Campylobacter coli]